MTKCFSIGTMRKRQTRTIKNRSRWLPALLLIVFNLTACVSDVSSSSLESQRLTYQVLAKQFELGKPIDPAIAAKLKNYPLNPYVEGMLLSQRLEEWPKPEMDAFLSKYDQQVPARKLRVEILQAAVRQKRWKSYLEYYRPEMATVAFRCYWLEALHQTRQAKEAFESTPPVWLNGDSFPTACDSPMNRWLNSQHRSDKLILERATLALKHNNQSLASFLVLKLSKSAKPAGEALLRIHDNPKLLPRINRTSPRDLHGEVLVYGLEKLLKIDSDKAINLWETSSFRQMLNPDQKAKSRELVGRRVIADSDANTALKWLKHYDPKGEDAYLLEWRIRLAMKLERWQDVSDWITLLPAPLNEDTTWKYWQARAWKKLDSQQHKQDAHTLLVDLAKKRDYYGFLAADLLNQSYSFNAKKIVNQPAVLTAKSAEALARATEFHTLNDLTSARVEWRQSMRDSEGQGLNKIVSAAEKWGWHSEIMRQAQRSGLDDYLDLRFPTPFKPYINQASVKKNLDMAWIYAIARQESAFIPDARSPVGALGLLQLMPSTATQIAKKQGYVLNTKHLTIPQTNIDLGSTYLEYLLQTFNNNRILATASYNGGPTRIKKTVLSQSHPVEHDVWIETLPYYETRDYVKRVLTYALIYDYQLNGNSSKLKLFRDHEKIIH